MFNSNQAAQENTSVNQPKGVQPSVSHAQDIETEKLYEDYINGVYSTINEAMNERDDQITQPQSSPTHT